MLGMALSQSFPRTKAARVDRARGDRPETFAGERFVAEILQPRELRPLSAASGGRDRALARIVQRRLGLATTGQLRAIGFSESTFARRVRHGPLHRVFRGVFHISRALARRSYNSSASNP